MRYTFFLHSYDSPDDKMKLLKRLGTVISSDKITKTVVVDVDAVKAILPTDVREAPKLEYREPRIETDARKSPWFKEG